MELIYDKERDAYFTAEAGNFEGHWVSYSEYEKLQLNNENVSSIINYLTQSYKYQKEINDYVKRNLSSLDLKDTNKIALYVAYYIYEQQHALETIKLKEQISTLESQVAALRTKVAKSTKVPSRFINELLDSNALSKP